jgi:hypothetical protein
MFTLEALDKVFQKLNMNALEFDNRQVNVAYESLRSAIEDFSALITRYCNFEDNGTYDTLRVPLPAREGEEEGYYEALKEIDEEVGKVTSAYDVFIKACSANSLDIYRAERD